MYQPWYTCLQTNTSECFPLNLYINHFLFTCWPTTIPNLPTIPPTKKLSLSLSLITSMSVQRGIDAVLTESMNKFIDRSVYALIHDTTTEPHHLNILWKDNCHGRNFAKWITSTVKTVPGFVINCHVSDTGDVFNIHLCVSKIGPCAKIETHPT